MHLNDFDPSELDELIARQHGVTLLVARVLLLYYLQSPQDFPAAIERVKGLPEAQAVECIVANMVPAVRRKRLDKRRLEKSHRAGKIHPNFSGLICFTA